MVRGGTRASRSRRRRKAKERACTTRMVIVRSGLSVGDAFSSIYFQVGRYGNPSAFVPVVRCRRLKPYVVPRVRCAE